MPLIFAMALPTEAVDIAGRRAQRSLQMPSSVKMLNAEAYAETHGLTAGQARWTNWDGIQLSLMGKKEVPIQFTTSPEAKVSN